MQHPCISQQSTASDRKVRKLQYVAKSVLEAAVGAPRQPQVYHRLQAIKAELNGKVILLA